MLLVLNDSHFAANNAADSAGLYWACPIITAVHKNGLKLLDDDCATDKIIGVSRLVNGNVPIENINGLDVRL